LGKTLKTSTESKAPKAKARLGIGNI